MTTVIINSYVYEHNCFKIELLLQARMPKTMMARKVLNLNP